MQSIPINAVLTGNFKSKISTDIKKCSHYTDKPISRAAKAAIVKSRTSALSNTLQNQNQLTRQNGRSSNKRRSQTSCRRVKNEANDLLNGCLTKEKNYRQPK
jgi:hypothetical protein